MGRFGLPAIAIAVLGLASCDSPWAVEDASEMTSVPQEYQQWYAEVSECMERPWSSERFSQITWYTASSIQHSTDRTHALALWTEPHQITIREDLVNQEYVVKHEIVHDILGRGSHPPPYFGRCAGI